MTEGGSPADPTLRLGISACLLGEPVRYDGGHNLDRFLAGTLGQFVDWVPVCPEAEVGMGVPRETIDLHGDPHDPRLLASNSRTDHTASMSAWARARLDQLATLGLHGYLFKSGSPSCGLYRVPVYDDRGQPRRVGRGLFALALTGRFPLLPVEEEGCLGDLALRESFLERVFAYLRWTRMLNKEPAAGGLVKFHTAYKMTLLAHSPQHYQELGRLVADAGKRDWDPLATRYGAQLMEGLGVPASRGKHTNVLQHLMGYLKNYLSSEDKQELLDRVEDYRQGLLPLIVPLTLLKHHLHHHPVPEWVHQQVYLHPYPKELMLRNHV